MKDKQNNNFSHLFLNGEKLKKAKQLKILPLFFLFVALLTSTINYAQREVESINNYLDKLVLSDQLEETDVSDWVVTAQHVSSISNVHHVYFRQKYQGLQVYGANSSVHILPNGGILKANDGFINELNNKIIKSSSASLSAIEAIKAAANEMKYPLNDAFKVLESNKKSNEYLISKGGISLEDIPAELMYAQSGNQFVQAWIISIFEVDAQNWWEFTVDASSGKILNKVNWMSSCDWGSSESEVDFCADDHSTHSHSVVKESSKVTNNDFMPMVGGYRVFPYPVESPDHGVRVLVNDPDNAIASPFGWHDTNGVPGAESTLTIGNNVLASEDTDGNNVPGFSPDGGGGLLFDFPLDLTLPPSSNFSPNITNLFYWNNIIHDVMYLNGFDEASGNFQENNYGNGGAGSDRVNADAQNPGNCNANFGTPPDGSNPRMQMFNCNNSSPAHDGDLDNLVIAHEYAHGISNRLTGGAGNTGCLNNTEQMGEGWSDYYGIILTIEPGDAGTDSRPVGTYLFGQPTNGPGIRPFPYSTDMGVNPHTYDAIKGGVSVPHGLGSVWCMMIWEMTWEIIATEGYDPDIYNGTGGNNIALALVTEGMKLQPCQPGFVDGRDAILAADIALYGGAYQCEIWTAFAKRGLGENATQGSSGSRFDGTEDFTVPAGVCNVMVSNDECEDAEDISCGDILSGTTIGMTIDNDPSIPFCGTAITSPGVWYKFTGINGSVTVDVCGATHDSKISIYAGSCGALVCVDGEDDDFPNCGSNDPQLTWTSTVGTDYYILVHGFGGGEGDFDITLNCAAALPNDDCTGALPLTCNTPVTGSTIGAGSDTAPFCGTSNGTGGGVWYTFVGDGSCVRLSTCNAITNYDTKLRVFTGSCAALVCEAGGDDDFSCGFSFLRSTVEFASIPGTTYYVLVHGFGSAEGTFQLDFECSAPEPLAITCPTDQNLSCGATIPAAATTLAAFAAQGGTATGGSCTASTYSFSSTDTSTGTTCEGISVMREYTVTNDDTGVSETCTQMISIAAPTAPTIVCPPDIVVACEDDIMLDPNDAVVTTSCGLGSAVYIKNPLAMGVPGCDGTVYTYIYVAVDDCGNMAECEQQVLIQNTPATLTVPAGTTVDCFDDIEVDVNDAIVNNGCADYNLYLPTPEINGAKGCPGTTYTYNYRLVDACGNVVEEPQVFTNGANDAPTIEAPVDVTVDCLAGVNPYPDNAVVTTSCTIGSQVTVTGPQISGTVDCPGTTYRYTYTVTDDCGRTATDIQTYTVSNSGPIFSGCDEDQWLQFNCEDYGGEDGTIAAIEAYIASVKASSSCGVQLVVTNNFNSNNINTCINNGINTITFRATDQCGRTSFCTTTYVVTDTEAPMIVEEAQDHWEVCNYNSQANLDAWVANLGGAMAYDGCSTDNVSWQVSPSNPQINCIGGTGTTTVTVTFIVTDNCGNKTETTATFNTLENPGFLTDPNQVKKGSGVTLLQNRPNPFKQETLIGFNLTESTFATLTIYDINGRVLKVVEGNYYEGMNEVSLSRADLGATGILYYSLRTDKETLTKTMILID